MQVGSITIAIFDHRADFLFFEKSIFEESIDVAKDGVEVARGIDIDSIILCNYWLALSLDFVPAVGFSLPVNWTWL